ncbi:MAG: four helix bundle protein [Bacteroidales bacterium]|nr:four helix bundle protein [Bacteroidales bacterium]
MGKNNALRELSYNFALRIVKLGRFLREDKNEFILSKQIVRSGTSIGANIEEASGAQSQKDFIAKLHISLKESKETHYWLRLLKDSGYTTEEQTESMLKDLNLIITLLTKSLKTLKSKES